MDTLTSVVATGVVVTIGRWSEGKGLSERVVIGGAVLAIGLAALDNTNSDFAHSMALLVLVASLFQYGIPIATKLGYTSKHKFDKGGSGAFGGGGKW